ncbi:hypothetical protein [Peribacillus loiseleuriae]|uniref:hypothetical protein n=1 Tax=Peribacillus loiseleuriae TaxID=1679170 RepID=UPI003CFECE6E
MKSDFSDIELAYATKEVAEKVGIAKPTVRKYAQMLEEHNYEFIKNGDRRVFIDDDIKAMEKMKISDNIERTAKELAARQKENMRRKSNIQNDIEKAIHRISPSDTILSKKEKETDIAFLETRYNQLLTAFKDMAVEYAATREKVDSIEENTSEIASLVGELMKKYEEEKEEKQLFKEKLNLAVDYIQKQEENPEKTEKKGIWKRIFG